MKGTKTIIILLVICLLCLVMVSCSGEKYSINFATNGGEEIPSVKLDKKGLQSFTLSDITPEKKDNIFSGWYFDNDTFEKPATVEAIIDKFSSKLKDITIYAKWKEIVVEEGTYLVNFETNGGSDISPITLSQNSPNLTLPDAPTKKDYIFDNWYFDNGTFAQVADKETILTKLSVKTPYVTVYAKWKDTSSNALSYLATSLDVFYNGVNKMPLAPSQDDIDRIVSLTNELPMHLSAERSLKENYQKTTDYLANWDKYQSYQRYIELWEIKLNGNDLTPEQEAELATIVENDDDLVLGDQHFNYPHAQDWVGANSWLYEITQSQLDALKDYAKIARVSLLYDEYRQKKDAFHANVNIFVKSLTTNDIRAIKIHDIATFLSSYDYASLLVTITDKDGYATNALDYARFTQFLLDMRSECGLTKEDTGVFYYRMLHTHLQSAIQDAEQEIASLLAELDLLTQDPLAFNHDNQLALNNAIDKAEKTKDSITSIKNELNQDYITETLDIMFGVAGILNGNKLIEYFDTKSTKNAPELGEIATVSASIKTACDQLLDKYNDGEYTRSVQSLKTILSSIESSNTHLNPLAAFVKAMLPDDPSVTLKKMSNMFGLITQDTLKIFLERTPDPDTNMYSLAVLTDADFFMANMSLLEAKIVTALTIAPYNEQDVIAAYDTLSQAVSNFLPHATLYFPNAAYLGSNKILLKTLSELVLERVKSRLLITAQDYDDIATIASHGFIKTDPIPSNLDILPFMSEFDTFITTMETVYDIKQSYLGIYDNSKPGDNLMLSSISPALVLYALEIDHKKLIKYRDYMYKLADEFADRKVQSDSLLLAYAFDGLFQDGCFDDGDIMSIAHALLEKGIDFVNDENLLDISKLSENASMELSFATVYLFKLYSSLAIIVNRHITTLDGLADSFADAEQTLKDFYNLHEFSQDDWSDAIATLKDIVDALKGIDGMEYHAEFIDYFISSPVDGAKKLADVMSLFTYDTLYLLVSESPLDINFNDQYFWDNLAILESKIITTLVDEDNLDALSNLYQHFINYLSADGGSFITNLLGITESQQAKQGAIQAIIDLFYDSTQDDVCIDIVRYNAISQKEYVQSDGIELTQEDFATVIFTNALKKIGEYNDLTDGVLTIINDLYQGSQYISGKVYASVLATMYIHDIDPTKINDYLIYLNDAYNKYGDLSNQPAPFDKHNMLTFFVLLTDGLIESGFRDDEITLISNNLATIALAYLEGNGDITNQTDIGKDAVDNITQTLMAMARLFHANDVLEYDLDNNLYRLNFENLIDVQGELEAVLDDLLDLYQDNQGYDSLMSFVHSALRGIFDYLLENTYSHLPETEYADTQSRYDIVLDLVGADFDLKGLVSRIKLIFNEYVSLKNLANDPEYNPDHAGNNDTVFHAKFITYILGDTPQTTYKDAIARVTSDTQHYELLHAFLAVYGDIKTLASTSYNADNLDEDALYSWQEFVDLYLAN